MNTPLDLAGAGTALVTPFDAHGELDLACFRALVRRQLDAGVALLVPGGTTGEAATLSGDEKRRLVRACLDEVAERGAAVTVLACVGGPGTRVALEAARAAASWGAHGLLTLPPTHLKPPQDALVAHFTALAEHAGAPLVIYDVPSRTGCTLTLDTLLALAELPGVVGLKDASGDVLRALELLRARPADFALLSGEDALTLPLLAAGAEGVISVVGNEAPRALVQLCAALASGDLRGARTLHERLLPLMRANFVETSPIPVKAALSAMGLLANRLRAPLRPLLPRHEAALRAALEAAGVELGAPAMEGVA